MNHWKTLIIGGGVAGLTVAQKLAESGERQVCVLEKSRGLGGRVCQKRAGHFLLDHVYLPQGLNELPLAMKADFPIDFSHSLSGQWKKIIPSETMVFLQTLVTQVTFSNHLWQVSCEREGKVEKLTCETLVVALPAPQAYQLLKLVLHPEELPLSTVHYAAHLILYTSAPIDLHYFQQAPFAAENSELARVKVEGREIYSYRLCYSDHSRFWDDPVKDVVNLLKTQYQKATHTDDTLWDGHRWKYSFPETFLPAANFWKSDIRLGVVGDYFFGGQLSPVESSWQSALSFVPRQKEKV